MHRVLKKIIQEKAEGVVVAPRWVNQPWFPVFLSLLKSPLLTFEPQDDLLCFGFRKHPMAMNLTLMAGLLSANR